MPRHHERGFILPLSVLLVVILTVSGTSFMHHDFLERRMAMNNVDNHGAFYLANAGLERARETFKVPQPSQSWDTVLLGTYDGPDPDTNPDYPLDPLPVFCALCLCGPLPARPCVMPSFGGSVNASAVPFTSPFTSDSTARYEVRAFNNLDDPGGGTDDTDRIMTFRALGTIRGEQKLLELKAIATTTAGWANCQDPIGGGCPDAVHPNADIDHLEGRDARTYTTLPTMDTTYYTDPGNFPWTSTTYTCSAGIDCSGSTITVDVANGGFYLIEGLSDPANTTVNIDASGDRQDLVIFSEAPLHVQGDDHFTSNTIFVSLQSVEVQGNITLVAPISPTMYPAIISGGTVGADNSVQIFGDIYATGVIDFRPLEIHGMLVGSDIFLQSAATVVTDDGNLQYYSPMLGITYPPEWLGGEGISNGWRELQ